MNRRSRRPHALLPLFSVLVAATAAFGGAEPPEFAQRHGHFTRSTIHFLGTAEATHLAARHDLRTARTKLLRRTLNNAKTLLDHHGEFPPYPAAWEDPEAIAAWQGVTDRMATVREKAARVLEKGDEERAVALVAKLRRTFRELRDPSGYPPGTFAFLRLRGTAKAARSVPPEIRQRLEKDLLERLSKRKERFASARKPLLDPDGKKRFERRLRKLVGMMRAMVRRDGPIDEKTVKAMHKLYPPFHRPAVLRELSQKVSEQENHDG